jgi:uncharacterized protein (TIGR00369 family)
MGRMEEQKDRKGQKPMSDDENQPHVPDRPTKRPEDSRMSLAIITHPGQANSFGTLHGGVILRLADECGAIVALRHAGGGRITTAAIDSLIFLGPVHPGERVEIVAEVTYVGRSSIETSIEVYAEPLERADRRKVASGFGLYVALDADGKPRCVPLLTDGPSEGARQRQAERIARRHEARKP